MAACKHPQTGRFFTPTASQCGIVIKADGVILRNLARALAAAVLHAARVGKAPRGLYVYACGGDPIMVRVP